MNTSDEQLRALVPRLQSSLEATKREFARQLHDDIGQALTVLSLEVYLLEQSLDETQPPLSHQQIRTKVKAIAERIRGVISSEHRITNDIRSKVLDEFGLSADLELQCEEFQRKSGIRSRFTTSTDRPLLEASVATGISSMAGKILSNAARHSGASRVDVILTEQSGLLTVQVSDNGRGITPEQIDSPQSLGLAALCEQACSLGASLDIVGVDGKGTTVTVQVPTGAQIRAHQTHHENSTGR